MELAPLIRDKPRLSEFLKDIPNDPGCYLMKDREDRLLYVGKSKKLRNRVRSYFRSGGELSPRISLMVRQIVDIELIVTDNESEARHDFGDKCEICVKRSTPSLFCCRRWRAWRSGSRWAR